MKNIKGYNKSEIKNKFNLMYKDKKSPWWFDEKEPIYLNKKDIIESYFDNSNVIIDLGCAEGNFLQSILKNEKYIIGVDIAKNAIELAKEKQIYKELYVGYIDDTDIYTKNVIGNIDLILLNEVLYYVDDYIEVLSKILSLSSKYIFISLAMGDTFFNKKDLNIIEKACLLNGYKIVKKRTVPMSYKFGIEIRYWYYIYKLFGKNLKQTHKNIYVFEKEM